MGEAVGTRLAAGEMLPDVSMLSVFGQRVRISDHRGHRALILLLMGESQNAALWELLRALAERYAEIRQEEADVLAIVPGSREAVEALVRARSFPFPLLVDEDRRAHRLYGVRESGGLFIADRYGEIYFAGMVVEGRPLPSVEEILSWVRFTEAQCPE